MDTLLIILLVLTLSMDVFSGLYLNGFIKEAPLRVIAYNVLTIAVFCAVMAALGSAVGYELQYMLEPYTRGFSIAILAVLGIKMLIKSFQSKFGEMTYELTKPRVMAGFALALSINAFLAGLALSSYHESALNLLITFFVVYAVVAVASVVAGRISDRFFLAGRMTFAGGALISAGAIYYLLELLKLL